MKSLPLPKAVLFDFGDTVCKLLEFAPLRGTEVLLKEAEFRKPVSAEEVQKKAVELNEIIAIKTKDTYVETHIFDYQKMLYGSLGISFKISDLEVSIKFWRNSASFSPAEGIFDLLDLLRHKSIPAGIVSNTLFTSDVIRITLDEMKLTDKFDFIITSAEAGYRKPSKLFMDKGIALVGCRASEIWFVGDKLENDVLGAINTGMIPIWYNPAKKRNDSGLECYEINHWNELSKYFL